jgi:hypothetical protein
MLYQQHVHQEEGIPHRLRPSMIVEVSSYFCLFQISRLNERHPYLQLFLFIEIVVPVKPVVVLFLSVVPDVIISAIKTQIGMIRSLLRAKVEPLGNFDGVLEVF